MGPQSVQYLARSPENPHIRLSRTTLRKPIHTLRALATPSYVPLHALLAGLNRITSAGGCSQGEVAHTDLIKARRDRAIEALAGC